LRFKYKRPNGKDGLMTLGNYPALTLKEARERRAIYLNQLANNIDPINQIKIEEANSDEFSFERIARDWHEAYVATGKWNQATARKALSNLKCTFSQLLVASQ
jgi:hypothetical protein